MKRLIKEILSVSRSGWFVERDAVVYEADADDDRLADDHSTGRTSVSEVIAQKTKFLLDLTTRAWGFAYDRAYNQRGEVALALLEQLCWRHHSRARLLLGTDPVRQVYRSKLFICSWYVYTWSYLLLHSVRSDRSQDVLLFQPVPSLVSKTVEWFGITNALRIYQRSSIEFSDKPIEDYTITEWKYTFDAVWECFWRHGWTPSTSQFLQALHIRAMLWLHPQPEEVDTKVYRHPNYCTPIEGAFSLPVLNPHLNLNFYFHAEKNIFHALRHTRAAQEFFSHPKTKPMTFLSCEWRNKMLRAWVDFMRAYTQNPFLLGEAVEVVNTRLFQRHLRPGEMELCLFETGSLHNDDVDAQDIFFDSRRAELTRLQELSVLTPMQHIQQWVEAMLPSSVNLPYVTNSDEEWDTIAAARPANERTALLVLETALNCLFNFEHIPSTECSLTEFAYVDNTGLPSPKDAPPERPENMCRTRPRRENNGMPFFVAISHLYSIVIPQPENAHDIREIWVTPYLTDALGLWLACAIKQKRLPYQRFNLPIFEKTIVPCLRVFGI